MKFFRRTVTPKPPMSVASQLHDRVRHCLDREAADLALEPAALAETDAVLDEAFQARANGRQPDTAALGDVISIHYLRSTEIPSPEDAHAFVTLAVWIHAMTPADVAPVLRDYVAQALARGAETDEPTAALRALQGYAAAVRAAWKRTPSNVGADVFVSSFTRLLRHTDPASPSYPTRLLDLAAAHSTRAKITPQRAADDLRTGITLARQALTDHDLDETGTRRAHMLLAPMLAQCLDEHEIEPDDVNQARRSFQALADLARDPAERAEAQHRLAILLREFGP